MNKIIRWFELMPNSNNNNSNNTKNEFDTSSSTTTAATTTINYNTSTYDDNNKANNAHRISRTDKIIEWLESIFNNNNCTFHTRQAKTEVGILTLDSEYDGINPTIYMAGIASYSLPTIDYCGCSTRLLTLMNTDLIF
jgi:hypothetical protein